jgi:hypothetical protein
MAHVASDAPNVRHGMTQLKYGGKVALSPASSDYMHVRPSFRTGAEGGSCQDRRIWKVITDCFGRESYSGISCPSTHVHSYRRVRVDSIRKLAGPVSIRVPYMHLPSDSTLHEFWRVRNIRPAYMRERDFCATTAQPHSPPSRVNVRNLSRAPEEW